jgi:phenylacetate-CoA ligase
MTRIKRFLIFSLLHIVGSLRSMYSESEAAYGFVIFRRGHEGTRWQIGKWKAWQVFEHARKSTPAYEEFLSQYGNISPPTRGWNPDLTVIPVMDKESYIKKFSIESRCVGGALPRAGAVIDESSGTSGTPNNWVRGPKERAATKSLLEISVRLLVGKGPIFFINAFALGPWATGMNVSMSVVDIAILKSTGPDAKKIENTLNFFGPKYHYIIAGYPPFLKSLVDSKEVDWRKFNIIAFFGGEGMSEGMRSYMGRAFKRIYGSYGASDLEINIGAENEFTIALRKKITENRSLRDQLVKHDALPMIFQYNPLDYYIETNDQGELIVTLCRLANVAPKVRYNIHDLGHIVRFPEFENVLKKLGMEMSDIGHPQSDLPFLFHYGRADMSVAFYGCKITPLDIEDTIFKNPDLAQQINSFSLIASEDEKLNKILTLALEMGKGKKPLENLEQLRNEIFETLKTVNQDYRESCKMIPPGFEPQLEVHHFGEGPFAADDISLKKHYIQKR